MFWFLNQSHKLCSRVFFGAEYSLRGVVLKTVCKIDIYTGIKYESRCKSIANTAAKLFITKLCLKRYVYSSFMGSSVSDWGLKMASGAILV